VVELVKDSAADELAGAVGMYEVEDPGGELATKGFDLVDVATLVTCHGKQPRVDGIAGERRFGLEEYDRGLGAGCLADGGNAVPSVKGADSVVLDGNYPAHAKSFLDMTSAGFEDFAVEAKVPGLSSDVSTAMLGMYQGKTSPADTITAVSKLMQKAV